MESTDTALASRIRLVAWAIAASRDGGVGDCEVPAVVLAETEDVQAGLDDGAARPAWSRAGPL
ncbi:hypothetical protein [Streptomyces sp. NPDC006140]|uniref:hypothetical protein n=1 Tax=Streptomyces sp. NPDC006140 TaxID=3154579 RepID=UPI0034090ACA